MNGYKVTIPSSVVERTTFVGHTVPKDIKKLNKRLSNLQNGEVVGDLLLNACFSVCSGDVVPDLDELAEQTGVDTETLLPILSGVHLLVSACDNVTPALMKKRVFQEDLDALKVPINLKTKLTNHIYKANTKQQETTPKSALPTIVDFKWRVDVTISTSALKRVLKPFVLLQTTLSDGSIKTFEVSIEKFHELRYNTAFVLKDVMEMSKQPAVAVFQAEK
eukprot:m.116680 g.116680  ORF g.116680 m.116680 type:complete len:220 (+) comp12861_c0_seq5:28-687(+)